MKIVEPSHKLVPKLQLGNVIFVEAGASDNRCVPKREFEEQEANNYEKHNK